MKLICLILSFSVISRISTAATTSNLRRKDENKYDHKKSPSSKPVTAVPKHPTSAPFKAITIKDALPKYASVVNGKLTYNFKVTLLIQNDVFPNLLKIII